MVNLDLEALERLCPEAVSYVKLALKMKRLKCEDAYQSIKSTDLLAITACIVRLGEENERWKQAFKLAMKLANDKIAFQKIIDELNEAARKNTKPSTERSEDEKV